MSKVPTIAPPPTIAHLVADRARDWPDRVAISFEEQVQTFAELDRSANAVCHLLAKLGVARSEHVAVMLENGAEAVQAWLGIARYGAIEVPLGSALRGDGLVYPLVKCSCRLAIVHASLLDRISHVRDRLPQLETVIVVGDAGTQGWKARLLEAGHEPYASDVAAEDTAVVLFSSGTTGPPKGVVLPHSAGFWLAHGVREVMGYGHDDVLFNAFPLSHVNARYTTIYPAMLAGARAVLHRRFSASAFWDICRTERITAFNYMGVIPVLLLNQTVTQGDRDHCVTRAYGAGAADKISDQFEERFGVPLVETYGSTELGMVSCTRLGERSPDSCGVASSDYQIEIQDELGWPLPSGGTGEIVVRPTRPGVMFSRYLGDPAATVEALKGLWFHTGDRGRRDSEGKLYFVDRVKDVIRRRGENISSWEVERVLEAHPAISEASAIGVDSHVSGQEVMVVLVGAGEQVAPAELLEHCEKHLPYYAVPRYVRFVDSLPRTASARVEKYRLREAGVTPDTWDREEAGYVLKR
ncbi:AMP-binding protein [Novosphingobium sp. JCM 18896]|uniref:AMP-binding protein n=1 Tax=Novosphingobium sp. JCM 18896 TaxID=2989731 RepID=UPI0022235F3C|nr:AMP-binding protein [Novosphingobium sp. JCM 18896]MCW1432289.1 AMP-binding protein [Novosphingobium sp. JCM 18896]